MTQSASNPDPVINKHAWLKPFLRFEWRLAAVLLLVFASVALWQSGHADDYATQVQAARAVPAPEGMIYMDYCDGRPSAQLSPQNEASCLADYPSEFALGAFAGLLGFLFGLISLSAGVWFKRRHG